MKRDRNKKTVVTEHYLTGIWDDGRSMGVHWITKESYDYVKKYNKIPTNMSPIKTKSFSKIGLKTVVSTWYPDKSVKI